MADQLYLSYRLRGYTEQNMLRHYEKLLQIFPLSRLSPAAAVLRMTALNFAEPPLLEQAFPYPVEIDQLVKVAREYDTRDCAIQLEAHWDLWQYDGDWKLTPSRADLFGFGPAFEDAGGDHLRNTFGLDALFLPQPDLPNNLFMARSNIRSLLHLVSEFDRVLSVESRRLWTESGDNFASRLQQVLEEQGIA
jgi:hypothetical protein